MTPTMHTHTIRFPNLPDEPASEHHLGCWSELCCIRALFCALNGADFGFKITDAAELDRLVEFGAQHLDSCAHLAHLLTGVGCIQGPKGPVPSVPQTLLQEIVTTIETVKREVYARFYKDRAPEAEVLWSGPNHAARVDH